MRAAVSMTLAAGLLFAATSLSFAEERQMTTEDIPADLQGVLFVNGLGSPIVDAFASPREHCDVFLCDQWRQLDREGWTLSPDKAAAMGMIFSTPEGQPRVCKWAVQVVTEDGQTYTFEPLDVCVPELRNRFDFRRGSDGSVTAVHTWRDEQGQRQTSRIAAN